MLLVVGELDMNVDPASTMQVVNALIKANKMFDLLVIPGGESRRRAHERTGGVRAAAAVPTSSSGILQGVGDAGLEPHAEAADHGEHAVDGRGRPHPDPVPSRLALVGLSGGPWSMPATGACGGIATGPSAYCVGPSLCVEAIRSVHVMPLPV